LGKICRQKRYVALIGFLSGFIVNTVVVIYFWVKGFSWKEPASNSAETLSVLGWSDSVLNIIIFMFCPIICLILALITLSIRKSRDEEKRITSEMQGLLATSTRRNQELGTKNSAKKQKRLAAEMKNGNDDTPG
jgi:hypothetical protein